MVSWEAYHKHSEMSDPKSKNDGIVEVGGGAWYTLHFAQPHVNTEIIVPRQVVEKHNKTIALWNDFRKGWEVGADDFILVVTIQLKIIQKRQCPTCGSAWSTRSCRNY